MKNFINLTIIIVITLSLTLVISVKASDSQKSEINSEIITKSIDIYKSLTQEQKAVILEKLSRMAQERQKAIESVTKQIEQLKLQGLIKKTIYNTDAKINELQIKKLALAQNSEEAVKKLENLISLYESESFRSNNNPEHNTN